MNLCISIFGDICCLIYVLSSLFVQEDTHTDPDAARSLSLLHQPLIKLLQSCYTEVRMTHHIGTSYCTVRNRRPSLLTCLHHSMHARQLLATENGL